jgi:hypothetical protein
LSLADDLAEVQKETDPLVLELRKALRNTQKQLSKAKDANEELVEAVIQAAKEATLAAGPIPPVPVIVKDKRKAKAEAALIHATDWQLGKNTADYNSDVARDRVMQFAKKIVRITEIQRADHPVKDCVVMFGGDMLEGVSIFPGQAFEVDSTLFEQFVNVSRLMVDFVRFLLANFENVIVISEHGNHGRLGSKRDGLPRHDNVDLMAYQMSSALLKGEKRLIWNIDTEDIKRVEYGNYKALLIHGDEIGRGGFSSPMTIVRHADRWRSGAYADFDFRDCFVGHYHQHQEWNMANGQGTVFMSASTESSNRYARDLLAANGTPSQRLMFIDPNRGRVTANYRVWLD